METWEMTIYPQVMYRTISAVYFRLGDSPGLFMVTDSEIIARVDGGDPGDEA